MTTIPQGECLVVLEWFHDYSGELLMTLTLLISIATLTKGYMGFFRFEVTRTEEKQRRHVHLVPIQSKY